ncbi:MAG: NAD(P)H-dependent oxidoreductase [Clostridia bacterium]|nr:NAD(P)H-dependent oxidoreductase [Clostridia bacterium]
MILFINACVRKGSRTARLAERFLSKTNKPYEEIRLYDMEFPAVDEDYLTRRDLLISEGKFDDPTFDPARRFAEAEEIVIAAPYWDLSFPSVLKRYLEQINAVGVTFYYTPEGVPTGLCRAKRLTYVTTAGGEFAPDEYGFGYVRALARNFWGIPEVGLISAAGLDIAGADAEEILRRAYEEYGI